MERLQAGLQRLLKGRAGCPVSRYGREGVPDWRGFMDVKTLISRCAQYHADRTAIVYGDARFTFGEVNERSIRLANGLLELGVGKNDRIGTILGNCPQYIEAMFAKHKIGAVDVILSPRLSTADL